MARWFEEGYEPEEMTPVSDMKLIVDREKNPEYEPRKEDVKYFLTTLADGRLEVVKMVVTSMERASMEKPVTALVGYFYGHPNMTVILKLPYLVFDTLEELKECYRKCFE